MCCIFFSIVFDSICFSIFFVIHVDVFFLTSTSTTLLSRGLLFFFFSLGCGGVGCGFGDTSINPFFFLFGLYLFRWVLFYFYRFFVLSFSFFVYRFAFFVYRFPFFTIPFFSFFIKLILIIVV